MKLKDKIKEQLKTIDSYIVTLTDGKYHGIDDANKAQMEADWFSLIREEVEGIIGKNDWFNEEQANQDREAWDKMGHRNQLREEQRQRAKKRGII